MKNSYISNLKYYANYYTKYIFQILWVFNFRFITILTYPIGVPLISKLIIDQYIPNKDKSGILFCIILFVIIGIIHTILNSGYKPFFVEIESKVSRDLRNIFVQKLQLLSLTYHNKNQTGKYFSKLLTDIEKTEKFAEVFIEQIFGSIFTFLWSIIILTYVNYQLLAIMLLIIPFMYLFNTFFRKGIKKIRYFQRMSRENLSLSISHFLNTSLLTRIHSEEIYEQRKVKKASEKMAINYFELWSRLAIFFGTNGFVIRFFKILITVLAANKVIDDQLTLGEMILFIALFQQILEIVTRLIDSYSHITEFSESIDSVREILEAPDIEHNTNKLILKKINGKIEFQNIFFSYEKNLPVLKDITVSIPPKTRVGLVGHSGSGKSTFIRLILGLYRTEKGFIKIDDKIIDSIDMRSVRKHVGVVTQEPIIFSGSIYDNIVHANKDIPINKVIEASKMANADEFISVLPKGYDTNVGENGIKLSGGQKQRIALTRALLRKPAILFLDEATSALDSKSEKEVQKAIDLLENKQTTFIIAHRLSTIKNVDLILVFKNGQIVEKGNHQSLLEKKGEYYSLIENQMVKEK